MATPFPFQAAATLLASQLNAITTLVTSTKTASHTLTIADVGTRVIMNSASATTITVNTSIFGASDVVEILNIGAGVCTVTAGTCTVGTSGTLALVQNAGGTLTFISASASVFRATAVAASSSGLVRVGGGALSSTTTTFSNVFSATFRDYLIIADGVTTASGSTIRMTIGSAAANYAYGFNRVNFAAAVSGSGASAQTDGWVFFDSPGTGGSGGQMIIYSPFLAIHTNMTFQVSSNASTPVMQSGGGILSDTTSHASFTLAAGSTMAGNISIYGLAIS